MSPSRHIAVVGGAATALAATALSGVFLTQGWWFASALGVAAVVAGMTGARALRLPPWTQSLAGVFALFLYLTFAFGRGHAILGVIPTPGTLEALWAHAAEGFGDIGSLAAPVPVRQGLLLLTVVGVGAIAILVDVIAVGLRRPALAGLPLLALYTVPVTIDRTSLSLWTFALGAAGYLWLLSTEHIEQVQRWGVPFRARGEWGTGRAAAIATTTAGNVAGPLRTTGSVLGVAGVVVALAVPAVLPVSTEGWLGIFGSGDVGAGAGRTIQTINPITQLRGQLRQGRTVELLQVRTNDPSPFYLRMTTLDQFNGSGWTQRGLSAKPSDRVSENDPRGDRVRGGVPSRRQQTNIRIRGLTDSPYLPIYANPRNIDVEGDWRWDRRSQSVFSTRNRTEGLNYSFDSVRLLYTPQLLAAAPPVASDDALRAHYTALGGGVESAVQATVRSLVTGRQTQFDKVAAINAFFSPRNGFVYTEETPPGTGDDDLIAFLRHKRGYCEQYASAMAYLVRAAGIPARVAVGFGYGESKDDYRSITNRDAHAWVEVYFSGLGWVPFDPTPPGGTGRTGNLSWTSPPPAEGPATGPGGTAQPTQPGAPTSASLGPDRAERDVDQGATAGGADTGPTRPLWQRILVPWTLGAVLLAGVLALPAARRWRVRRRRLTVAGGTDPVAAAHAAWDEIGDTVFDLGEAGPDSETPRSLSRRLGEAGLTAEETAALRLLAHAEEQARYAPRTTSLPGLPAAVEEVRAALDRRAARRARLSARLMPASVRADATAAVLRWNESVSVALAERRAAAARRLVGLRRLVARPRLGGP